MARLQMKQALVCSVLFADLHGTVQ